MSSNPTHSKKMEAALNDWLERVEEQVNIMDDKLQEKATVYDLQQFEYKLQSEARDRKNATDQIV